MRTLPALALLALPLAARADVLDPALVDARAQVLIHLDVDALQKTTLWKHVIAERGERIAAALADFEAEVGLDPLEDVRSITVYSTAAEDERWVALLRTSARLDEAVSGLAEMPGYARLEVEGKTVHALDEGERTWFGHAFRSPDLSERLFAITEDQGALLDAIAVVEGRRESLSAAVEPEVASRPSAGATLFVSASRRLREIGRFEPAAEVSRLLRGVVIEAGETEGDLFAEVRLSTATHDDALSVQQLAQGLLALGALVSSRAPDAPFHGELLRALRVDRTGTVVSLSLRAPAQKLIEDLQRAHAGHAR